MDLATNHVHGGWGNTAVRDMGDVALRAGFEHFKYQVVDASRACRSVIKVARLGAGQRHQLLHGVDGQILVHCPNQGAAGNHADGCKVAHRVVSGRRQCGWHGGEGGRNQQQCVAIGSTLGHML